MTISPFQGWNLHLLFALVQRDFRAQYRRSLIGPLWALLYSSIFLGLFVLIRSFLGIPSDGKPYVLFAAVGIMPWTFFSGAVGRSSLSILQNGSLLKKIAARKEIFPIAAVLLSIFDFLVMSVLILGLLLWYDIPLNGSIILLPFFILMLSACALGVGMIVSSAGVFRRDLLLGLPFLLQIWMFLSPIMYPLSVVPESWRLLYSLNPMVGITEGMRAILLEGAMPDMLLTTTALLGTATICLIGWSVFRLFSQYFVDAL